MARRLTPYEHVVFVLLESTDRDWKPFGGDHWPSVYEKAVKRLVAGGLMEAKVPVRILMQSPRRRLDATWRVTGEFGEELQKDVRHHMQTLGVEESDYVARPKPFTAVRLTADGEVAKLLLREILVPHKEPSEEDWWVMWTISGGPSGEQGDRARGEVTCLDGDDPFEIDADSHSDQKPSTPPDPPVPSSAVSPTAVMLAPESFGPLAEPLRSIESAIREGPASGPRPSGQAGDPPPASPKPEGSSPDIVKKLDALLMASKYRQAAGRFGRWEPRNSAHNNQIVGRLLDALPEVSVRDAARILGAGSHTSVVRTETWKQRRGEDGADASSYAEHHQNMQYDEDARAQDPAKVVATREQQAAQLRKVIIELGMTSMFRGIDDDAKLLDDLEKLSRKNPTAFKRISDTWVVQCTAPHQPEDS